MSRPHADGCHAASLADLSCLVCGGEGHVYTDCPFWRYRYEEGEKPAPGVRRAVGCHKHEAPDVAWHDVPGDGICMYHAIGEALAPGYPAVKLGSSQVAIPTGKAPGMFWRAFLRHKIRTCSIQPIDGVPVSLWDTMATGLSQPVFSEGLADRARWGGFFEMELWARAFGRGLCIVVMSMPHVGGRRSPEGEAGKAAILAYCGACPASAVHITAVAWRGDHYVRVTLGPRTRSAIERFAASM